MPSARFDNLTDAALGFRLVGYRGEVVARHPGEVAGAIAAAAGAAAQGLWAAGFVSYEAAPGLDPALTVRDTPVGANPPPLVWFGLFERQVPVPPPSPTSGAGPLDGDGPPAEWSLDTPLAGYQDRVRQVKGHIAAGDTYQLNLTTRWRGRWPGDVWPLYQRLALAQRPAYAALIDTGRHVVASASPELFFDWRGTVITCRPMKGTAARGRWSEEDQAAGAALVSSPKDRAENVMIVDLVRNDLGRLAEYGSVAVTDLFRLERYPSVWQLTSAVEARARLGTTLVEVFQSLFPCGSVTGAPKRRTMELIAEVESTGRGVYCGAVGFVGPGHARFNVAIRTAVVDRGSGQAVFGSGGGIIWDSEPEGEFAEGARKAGVLFAATDDFDLVETMAFEPGTGLRSRDRHLSRLAGSAAYFGYPFCPGAVGDLLESSIAPLAAPARVRLSLSRHGEAKVEATPLVSTGQPSPVRLAIDERPVDSSDTWLFHKTTRRQVYESRRHRHPTADDVVLVNERGEVTETTIANLAVCLEGQWVTPPLTSGCLPGVGRASFLDEGALVERPVTVAVFRRAEQVAVVSSLRGWRPAVVKPG